MMSTFGKDKHDLTYRNIDVSVKFDMALLRIIDHELGIDNLFKLMDGTVKYTKISDLISLVFLYGGKPVSPEDVYEYMFDDDYDDSMIEVFTLTREIINLCFPSPKNKEGGKKKQ